MTTPGETLPPPAGSGGRRQRVRRRRWPRVLLSVAATVILLLSLAGLGIDVMSTKLQGNITAVDIQAVPGSTATPRATPKPVVDEQGNYSPVNILLMGSDSREGDGKKYGDPKIISGQRSDTTILLHLSADRTFATAVSIPRDTLTQIPQCVNPDTGETVGGFEGKFNSAFEIAGPGCTVQTVEDMTGLTIDHFAVINFAGFKEVVDALGGVEVCLTEAVDDPMSKLVLPAGTSIVSGEQALGFVRARETLGDGSDLGRIKRQQAFLSSMIREASSTQLLLNPVKLYSVLDAATSSLTTDKGLADMDTLQSMALSAQGTKPGDITFLTMPWVPAGDNENVLMDAENAAPLWESIQADVPWLKNKKPEPSASGSASGKASASPEPNLTVAPEEIQLRVLNGTATPGRAAEVAAALEAQGFTIIEVNDAERTDYTKTEIHHTAPLAEAARTVLQAFAGAQTVADESADPITIIVGSDYTATQVIDMTATPKQKPNSAPPSVSPSEIKDRETDEITAPTTADKVKCN